MSVGSILGYLDRFYFAIDRLHLCKQRPLFFSDGFGNPEKLEHCEHVVAEFFEKSIRDQRPISAPPLSDTPDSIVWEPYSDCNQSSNLHCRSERRKSHSEFIHRLGSFQSPFSDQLPASSQRASFLLVAPRDVSGPWREKTESSAILNWNPSTVIVLMPSTGEQDYTQRLPLAHSLVASKNAVCLLLMSPYYGDRRPPEQCRHFIGNVADFIMQSVAIGFEAAMLLEWAHTIFPHASLCSTGFSWGGYMCSAAGVIAARLFAAKCNNNPTATPPRIAVVPYVGGGSSVVVYGLLSGDVDWNVLCHEARRNGRDASLPAVRADLFRRLDNLNISRLVEQWQQAKRDGPLCAGFVHSLVSVSMSHDGFVRSEWSGDLLRTLKSSIDHRTYVRSYQHLGGHVVAFLRRAQHQLSAVHEALEQIERSK